MALSRVSRLSLKTDYNHLIHHTIDIKTNIRLIFESHYKSLVVYASTFICDLSESEDVVQNIFFKLWQSELVFLNENEVKSYLFKAVKNSCLNKIKHEIIKDNYKHLNKDKLLKTESSIDEFLTINETMMLLHSAICNLPDRKREIIKLTVFVKRN